MNTATIRGNWNITKGKLKQKFAQLTDDDLVYVEGQEEELLGRIQRRTGHARDEIESFLRDECECDFTPAKPPGAALAADDRTTATGRAFRPSHAKFPMTESAASRRSPSNASFKKISPNP